MIPSHRNTIALKSTTRRSPIEEPSESSSHEVDDLTTQLSGVSSSSFQKKINEDVSKLVHSITSRKANMAPMVKESVGVITLAGENTGATIQLTSESSKKENIHFLWNYRSNPDESVERTTDVEEDEGEIGQGKGEESENCGFLNSNVQGMNNSVSEGSPGDHFKLALNPEPQLESKSEIGSSEAFKDQFNVMLTEKRKYEPTIRRSCLRGIFMESSDSDDNGDNPGKLRHHSCRFGCES